MVGAVWVTDTDQFRAATITVNASVTGPSPTINSFRESAMRSLWPSARLRHTPAVALRRCSGIRTPEKGILQLVVEPGHEIIIGKSGRQLRAVGQLRAGGEPVDHHRDGRPVVTDRAVAERQGGSGVQDNRGSAIPRMPAQPW